MIEDILKKVHRKVSKDTDYPVAGSEDLLVTLDHVDDAISEWEDLVQEGYNWPELMVPPTAIVFGGTGTDALPADFLDFPSSFGDDGFERMELLIGNSAYAEVSSGEGEQLALQGVTPNVYWMVAGFVRTLPAASGTVSLPYLKKATRFVTGAETTEPEMSNQKFIEDYVTAKLFLDNADDTLYQAFMNQANDKLMKMKYKALT
ncbi:MAG: hypothetical protein WC823_00250 [Parcubacteria group bacterium]|jgi:hypothetical protein